MSEGEKNQPLPEGRRGFSNLRALGATALAIVLYVLLVVAAIETFISRSPVKWWVAIIVAAYLGGSAALWWRGHPLWQRYTWETKATISFFVLIGLLALTVWLPGGLTQGLKLFGLSTSMLLSLVTALAVAYSGIILFRVTYPHPAIKWVIGGLAAYGVIAFLWAIPAGTPYPDLFRGRGFGGWVPRLGAFVGALVLVAALLYQIFNILRQARGIEVEKWGLQQVFALGLSLVMVVSGFITPAGFGGAQPSAAQITEPLQKSYQDLAKAMTATKEDVQVTPTQVADRLEKLFKTLEEAERQIPRDTFDPKAIVEKVGRDPTKLFEWVRDNTYLVPYRGLLRGETGVLMDRLGNSLDRAMLLYALLGSAGHQIQLAHGTLTEKQAEEVLEKARPIPKDGVPALRRSREIPDDLLQTIGAQNQIDQGNLRKLVTNVTAEQERLKESVMRRVSEQASVIAAAVGKPKEDLRKKEEAAAVESVRDHWWVQWQDRSAWVDLDPTLPDNAPGQAFSVVKETTDRKKLPSNLHHEVRIRVVVEQWEGGSLNEKAVLSHNLRPSEMFGKHITLRHVPLNWPRDLNLFQEKEPLQRLKATVLAQNEWLPVLNVGDNMIAQSSFTDSGESIQTPLAPILGGGAQKLGSKIGGMFGGGGIGEAPPHKPKKEAHLTAEWIEYEIRVPGQTPRKIRREIFDLVGPAARSAEKLTTSKMTEARRMERGLTLLGETEILPLANQLSPQFVEHLITKNMVANREVLLVLLRAKEVNPKLVNDQLGKVKPLTTQLYSLALARTEWSQFRGDIYVDRPNILSFYKHPRLDPKGLLLLRQTFDIVANDIAVRSGSGADPFLIRLEQGVLDTNAEAVLMVSDKKVENTAEIFAEAGGHSIEWLTIRNARDREWRSVELPKDVRARIEQDLEAGFAVMVPKKAVPLNGRAIVGWWRIDLRSGQTLGIGDRGWGQTTSEKLIIIAVLSLPLTGICMEAKNIAGKFDEVDDAALIMEGLSCFCFVVGAMAASFFIGAAGLLFGIGAGCEVFL